MEKRETLYTVGKKKVHCNHYGKQYEVLKKIKIESDLAIPRLSIYPKERKSLPLRFVSSPMFMAALFTVARI